MDYFHHFLRTIPGVLISKTSLCTTQTLSVVDDVDVDPEVFGEWGEKIAAEKGSIRSSSSQLEGQGAWKREELLVRQQRRHRHGLWVPVTKVCARRSTIYMHSNICRHTSASRTLIFMCGDSQTSTVWGGFCQMLGNPAVWSVDRPLGSSTLVAFQGYSRVIMVCF